MEDEKDFDRLERLERSVERLLSGYNALRQEKASLEQQLDSKNAEIDGLQQIVADLKGEKSFIHQRVSGLLSSIEEWEENQVESAEGASLQEDAEEDESSAAVSEVEGSAGGGISATMDDPQLSMMSVVR